MADITMCNGEGCWRASSCYRHIAPINEFRQAYFANPPWKTDSNRSCDYYWPILDETEQSKIKVVDKIKNL